MYKFHNSHFFHSPYIPNSHHHVRTETCFDHRRPKVKFCMANTFPIFERIEILRFWSGELCMHNKQRDDRFVCCSFKWAYFFCRHFLSCRLLTVSVFSPFADLSCMFSPLCRMHIMRANVALKLHVNSPNYRRNAIHIRNIHIILFSVHARLSSVYLCFCFRFSFHRFDISFHAGNYCRSDNSLAYTHVSIPTSRFHIFECSDKQGKDSREKRMMHGMIVFECFHFSSSSLSRACTSCVVDAAKKKNRMMG